MRKLIFFLIICITVAAIKSNAQNTFFTRNGYIYFISRTDFINLDAHNHQVGCVLDIETGEMAITVLNKSFRFKYALAEEHFNENYMETHLYPRASFKGMIRDIDKIDFTKKKEWPVVVEGELSMRGITNSVRAEGKLKTSGNEIKAESKFNVKLNDYNIKVPSIVIDKVNEVIEIEVKFTLKPLPAK